MNITSKVLSSHDETNPRISETALKNTINRISKEKRSLANRIFALPMVSLKPLAVSDQWRDGYLDGWNNGGDWDQSWNEGWSNS